MLWILTYDIKKPSANNITIEKFGNSQSVEVSDATINSVFFEKWNEKIKSANRINKVTFRKCLFEDGVLVFMGLSVQKLHFIKCEITAEIIGEILENVNPYTILEVTFSKCNLDENNSEFKDACRRFINPNYINGTLIVEN